MTRSTRRDWLTILLDAQTRGITMAQLAREQGVWSEIFADALTRGLGVTALAREQGVTKANVVQRSRTYKVTLPGQYKERAR